MKNRLQRWMILMAAVCIMGYGACGCGRSEEPSEPAAEQAEEPEDDAGEGEAEPQEPEADPDTEDPSSASDAPQEQRTDQGDLTGDILELGRMQFTVTENVTEETEDGGMVIASPAPGTDSSDFKKVTVTYDEDTVFSMRTVYDGGARYEDADGSAEDLTEEMLVVVWGTYEEDGTSIHAAQIRMEQFVR